MLLVFSTPDIKTDFIYIFRNKISFYMYRIYKRNEFFKKNKKNNFLLSIIFIILAT